MRRLSRRGALGLIGAGALFSAGCMTKPMRPPNSDGSYCFAVGKIGRQKLTCTQTPIPPEAVEAEAKQFEPKPDLLTVYVVRKRWGDTRNQVRLSIDGGPPVVTTPESFVRLRLWPGAHSLSATWDEGATTLDVNGTAGQMQFVELVGSVWAWGSAYRLDRGDPEDSRQRVARLRLVADVLP